jgi:hypothetical protein
MICDKDWAKRPSIIILRFMVQFNKLTFFTVTIHTIFVPFLNIR